MLANLTKQKIYILIMLLFILAVSLYQIKLVAWVVGVRLSHKNDLLVCSLVVEAQEGLVHLQVLSTGLVLKREPGD